MFVSKNWGKDNKAGITAGVWDRPPPTRRKRQIKYYKTFSKQLGEV